MTRGAIRFLWRGETVEIDRIDPMTTVLDWLRVTRGAVGTKEGCNEGDCGACTVAVASLKGSALVVEPANACILLVGQLDGRQLITVEDLAEGGVLHPVQAAMVRHHGSQCGFCTPGFVMSLFCMTHTETRRLTKAIVDDWIAGNLCRCTGYRPISDAGLSLEGEPRDALARSKDAIRTALEGLADGADLVVGDDAGFFAAPASEAGLIALLDRHRDATILGGATDVGLWITKQLRTLPKIVHTGRVESLRAIEDHGDRLVIGAAATYAEAEAAIAAIDPDLGELWRRIGSKQVRASGTVGGNVANGSPIGDTPPALIALGAEVEIANAAGVRRLPLEDFFVDYGKQARERHELVTRLIVPKLAANQRFRAIKISKRFDQDISAVMAGFRFTLDGGRIVETRIAYGGMAATPKRARAVEAALVGADPADPATHAAALTAYAADYRPIDDMRASARYRLTVARNLLVKALAEIAGTPSRTTRLVGVREDADAAAA